MTPLQFAIENNKQDAIIQLLLSQDFHEVSKRIDVNKRSKKTIIKILDIEVFEQTPLYMSIEKKNIYVIKTLLAREDININEKSFYYFKNNLIEEKTALHLAVEMDDIIIVKLLLEKKEIDINLEDLKGKKPIDYSKNDDIRNCFCNDFS